MTPSPVFETERLVVRRPGPEDAELYVALWTCPEVMRFVGFPEGLPVTREKMLEMLGKWGPTEFDGKLVVVLKESGERIGEVAMHRPGEDGVSKTDVKLLPAFWGHRYGAEVKQGLVDHLFTHTDCAAVQGEPNKENIASIRMQEAVGAKRVAEGLYEFEEEERDYATCPVPHYVYRVFREDWERR